MKSGLVDSFLWNSDPNRWESSGLALAHVLNLSAKLSWSPNNILIHCFWVTKSQEKTINSRKQLIQFCTIYTDKCALQFKNITMWHVWPSLCKNIAVWVDGVLGDANSALLHSPKRQPSDHFLWHGSLGQKVVNNAMQREDELD